MNLGEHRQALLDDLSKTSTDTFHTTAILNRYINRAIQWVGNSKNWQQTQKAEKQTITLAGDETDEYWNYPENFKSDSIYRVALGDSIATEEHYQLLIWEDYLNRKEDTPDQSVKVASDHRRQIFIYPIPTTDGQILSVWGHEMPDTLVNDADEHPFTGEQLLEEAINRYAMGLALRKMRGTYRAEGDKMMAEASALLESAWKEQRQRQASRKVLHAEAWEHTNFLDTRGGTLTKRGSFNLDY